MTDEQRKLIESIKSKTQSRVSSRQVKLVVEEDKAPVEIVRDEVIKLTEVVSEKADEQADLLRQNITATKRIPLVTPDSTPEIKKVKESIITATSVLGSKLDSLKEVSSREKIDNTPELIREVKKATQALEKIKLPTNAKDALPVRLSDGEEFYKAVTEVITTGMQAVGGGGSVPKITLAGGIQAVPVVNPDGTNISAGGGGGGTSMTDDAAFTVGTTSFTPIGGTYKFSRDSVDNNDGGAFAMTEKRALYASLETPSGDSAMDETNDALRVNIVASSGTVPVSQSGSWSLTSYPQMWNGSAFESLTGNAANGLDVDVTRIGGTVAVTQSGTWDEVGINDSGNSITVDNGGTFVTQENGAALTALQLIDDTVFTDDAAFTPATSKVIAVGFQADETSTDSVDEGDAGAARMTLDRKQIVTPQPHTTGGCTIFRSLDLDESEEEVKASAGQVYGLIFTNTATTTRWLKFYNATAANVTVGTTTPVITIGLPGNSSDDISGLFNNGGMGIAFDTAISVAATTGVADNDTGAPSANDVIVNIFYK
jgi:hypothetical protein